MKPLCLASEICVYLVGSVMKKIAFPFAIILIFFLFVSSQAILGTTVSKSLIQMVLTFIHLVLGEVVMENSKGWKELPLHQTEIFLFATERTIGSKHFKTFSLSLISLQHNVMLGLLKYVHTIALFVYLLSLSFDHLNFIGIT